MPPRLTSNLHRHDRLRLVIGLAAPVLLVAALAAGCGDDEQSTGSPDTTQPPTTITVPTDGEPDGSDDVPECDEMVLDNLMRETLGSSDGPEIDHIEITNCDGGFARVLVVPVESNYETEQVFLRGARDDWEIIDFGTGLSCGDDDLDPDLAEACAALGLD